MRSPAVNLFNTNIGEVTVEISDTGSGTNHKSRVDLGKCQWYLYGCPNFGTGATSWKASSVTVKHVYYIRIQEHAQELPVLPAEYVYLKTTTNVYSSSLPTDSSTASMWSYNVATSITTQSWYTTSSMVLNYPDCLEISFVDDSGNKIILTLTLSYGASVQWQFNFVLKAATWTGTTAQNPTFITDLIITKGATNYTWNDIYSPIATNEELLDDSGVIYENITDLKNTPDYAKKAIKYDRYYFEDTDGRYYRDGDYIQYKYHDNGYSVMFPVNTYTSQSYVTNQAIRYADIDFSRAFEDPSGSW